MGDVGLTRLSGLALVALVGERVCLGYQLCRFRFEVAGYQVKEDLGFFERCAF